MFNVIKQITLNTFHTNTDKVLPYALWNFGNYSMNTVGLKLFCEKQFLLSYICKMKTTHADLMFS